MSEKPKTAESNWSGKILSNLALAELNGLQKAGLNPSWEQVVKINDLCRKVEKPTTPSLSATGKPVRHKDRLFWPFTIQSAEWFSFIIPHLSEDQSLIALLFAFEHGRAEEFFVEYYDLSASIAKLNKYKRTLNMTLNECVEIIGELGEGDESDEKPNENTHADPDELIGFLVCNTGLPAEYWQSRVSLSHSVHCVDIINRMKSEKAPQSTEYIKAEKALGKYLMEIKRNG